MIKLKDNINFKELLKYGFVEDELNVEYGDHFYSSNNYYKDITINNCDEFRLTINMIDRILSIKTLGYYGLRECNKLDTILLMVNDGLLEIKEYI